MDSIDHTVTRGKVHQVGQEVRPHQNQPIHKRLPTPLSRTPVQGDEGLDDCPAVLPWQIRSDMDQVVVVRAQTEPIDHPLRLIVRDDAEAVVQAVLRRRDVALVCEPQAQQLAVSEPRDAGDDQHAPVPLR